MLDPLVLFCLIIGSFLIYVAVKVSNKKCPESKVIYKFIPRTFTQEQNDPVKVSDIFSGMFNSSGVIPGYDSQGLAPKQLTTTPKSTQ
jgi:hypothetical protein